MSKVKKRNVLVTGAGGFVGKSVVRTLLARGFMVTAMIRENSIPPFNEHPNLCLLRADITEYESFSEKVTNIDAVVHLAANKYHPKLSYQVNVKGAKNLVRLLKEKKIRGKRIINISSQSTKIRYKGVYGKSKLLSDEIIENSNAKWTTIKPSLIYGEGKETLFQTIRHYIETLPLIPVIGNGKWELYPVDVEEVANVIVKLLNKPKTIGKIYDIGCSQKITFNDLILLIQKELNIKKPILNIPGIAGLVAVFFATKIMPNLPISVDNVLGSIQNTSCDPKKAIKELNIKPISIKKGVKKYIKTLSNEQSISVAIVGLGKMGILHATIINSIPKAKIVALVDIDKKLGQTARSMGIDADYYSSLENALKSKKIDAVFICTPTFAHMEIIDICNKNNIPYFVEKPVLNDFSDYKKIKNNKFRKIFNKSNAGYFWIYKREVEYTKKLLMKKTIGKIRKYKVNLKHSEVFGQKKGWLFSKKLSGGGVLANPGPHALSLINYLFGKGKVEKASLKYIYANEVEDEATVTFSHPNNITGMLNASWSIPNHLIMTIEYKIVGSNGYIEFRNRKLTIKKGNRKRVLGYHEIPFNHAVFNLNIRSGGDAYYLEDSFFIQSLINNSTNHNDMKFAYVVEKMLKEIYDKSEE
jgi:NADH dehydrogenase